MAVTPVAIVEDDLVSASAIRRPHVVNVVAHISAIIGHSGRPMGSNGPCRGDFRDFDAGVRLDGATREVRRHDSGDTTQMGRVAPVITAGSSSET